MSQLITSSELEGLDEFELRAKNLPDLERPGTVGKGSSRKAACSGLPRKRRAGACPEDGRAETLARPKLG